MPDAKHQFRIFYREFLFRVVDFDLLSSHAQGDASKLLGQFAALLIFLSILFALPSLGSNSGGHPIVRLVYG